MIIQIPVFFLILIIFDFIILLVLAKLHEAETELEVCVVCVT